jgi:putative membrane protein
VVSEETFRPQLRLHALSWLFSLTSYVKQMMVPIVAFIFFGARDDGELWGALIFVPLLVGALWQQWVFRYGYGPRGLVVQDGLLFRSVRLIEYARIENIDVERGVLHRLLGVALVRIATSTGGKAEATLRVLNLAAVEDLRACVFARREHSAAVSGASESDEVLLHVAPGELVRYGLIDNRGLIVVAAAFGLISQNSELARLFWGRAGAWFHDSSWAAIAGMGIALQVGMFLATLIGIVLSLRLLSIAIALVTLFDFTLSRHGADFRIRHGLLTRVALTLRVRRVQAVHQTATLLHRAFGRVSLRVDLAGDSAGDEHKQQPQGRTRWLAPICTPSQARELLAQALPDADLSQEPDWQPLAPGARLRMFRRGVYVGVLIVGAGALALHFIPNVAFTPGATSLMCALLAILLFAWLRATLYVRHTRWALTPDAIYFHHGWLTRRLAIAPRNRVQSVVLAHSPFDRRSSMASVSLDTAGASASGQDIHIPMLHAKVAHELANALYRSRVTHLNLRSA